MKVLVYHGEHTPKGGNFYFEIRTANVAVQSTEFADRTSCVERAYEVLTYIKRNAAPKNEMYLSKRDDIWVLNISNKYQLALVQPETCKDSEDAQRIVNQISQGVNGNLELIDIQSPEDVLPYAQTETETTTGAESPPLPAEPDDLLPLTDPPGIDDYHPDITPASDRAGFHTFSEIINGEEQFFFHFNDSSGTPLLFSEAYRSAAGRDRGMASVKIHGTEEEQYDFNEEGEEFRFRLIAKNQQEIARSRFFDDRAEMLRYLFWLRTYLNDDQAEKKDSRGTILNPGNIMIPRFSSGAIPQTGPCGPIFKPLEPLTAADISIFWGRDKELKEVYKMIMGTNLLLLYGAARSGKSSLVRCGLPNQYKSSEWHGVIVERHGDINKNFRQRLHREWKKLVPKETAVPSSEPMEIIRSLQEYQPQTTYLIFDDLEELFTDEPKPEEQEEFFNHLYQITQSDGRIKAILIIDETYLAHLTNYESVVPNLFEHRYRLERMSMRGISTGLVDCLEMLNNMSPMQVPDPKETTESIMERMSQGKDHIEVACMQIYMNELQQKACADKKNGEVLFDKALVEKSPPPEEMIESYLNDRRASLQNEPPEDPESLQHQLKELDEVQARCQCAPAPAVVPVAAAAPTVYPSWVSWTGWVLLLLLLLLFFWPKPAMTDVNITSRPESCAACEQYLSEFGEAATYGAYAKAQLTSLPCQEWADCRIARETESCGTYIKYLEKYRNTGSCSEDFLNEIIKSCLLPANTDVIGNCKLLTEILPVSDLPTDMLCLIYDEYIEAFGADNSCTALLREQRDSLRCTIPEAASTVVSSCAALRAKAATAGGLSSRELASLEQCACDEAFGKADCDTYEYYLKTYGNNGRCADDIQRALAQLRKLNCPLPMGDVCYLTATKEPVTWANAHTQCPQGYKLICANQVRYLLKTFYGNDLKKSYAYMIRKIEDTSISIDTKGFWTATEYSDTEAYAIEKDATGKAIKTPEGVDKSESRPCLCISPGPKFQNSPIRELQCLSKSLSN